MKCGGEENASSAKIEAMAAKKRDIESVEEIAEAKIVSKKKSNINNNNVM
jgi:hypothetical protein